MPLEVVWAQLARDDLQELEDYIAADRPRAAAAYRLRIVERCEGLADFPHTGPIVDAEIGLHFLAFETVSILYQVTAEVVILRILGPGREVGGVIGDLRH